VATIWPLCYLSPYLINSERFGRQSGNDFNYLYYVYKVYLLDVLANEHRIPLWSPSEACGYPFYSNPFVAAYYPLNLVLALFYRWNGGYSERDHQVFTVLAVSIYCLGLYLWLRSHSLFRRHALFAALVMSTSLKVTEILRFPNAIHAAAWMPWILYGVNQALQKSSSLKGMALVTGATLMLLTAAYPYYAFYLQFLVGPYLLLLVFPACRKALGLSSNDDDFLGLRRGTIRMAVAFSAAVAICCPYLWKMRQLLSQTQERGGLSFEYSMFHEWSWADTLGSLCYPPAAMSKGWYFFGIMSLAIILSYLFCSFWTWRRNGTLSQREALFSLLMLAWIALISAFTFGKRFPLTHVFWSYWPGFSSLRVWPRLNIVLVPVLAMLLARSYAHLEGYLMDRRGEGNHRFGALWNALSLAVCLVAVTQAGFLLAGYKNYYWTDCFTPKRYAQAWHKWVPILVSGSLEARFVLTGSLSVAVLGAVVARCQWRPIGRRGAAFVVCVLLLFNTLEVAPVGILQWSEPYNSGMACRQEFNVKALLSQAALTPRYFAGGHSINPSPDHGLTTLPSWYFERYSAFLGSMGLSGERPSGADEVTKVRGFAKFMGMEDGQRLFFVKGVEHASIPSFLADAEAVLKSGSQVQILDYSGDAMRARVAATCDGYLVFVDNWDPDWRGEVDGRRAAVERVFGTFKAIQVKAGSHVVQFAYRPFF
jgi:hypothetical protein